MQVFFKIFREKWQHHRTGTVDKCNQCKYPDFTGKAAEIIDVSGKGIYKHLKGN